MRFEIPGFTQGQTDDEVARWEKARLIFSYGQTPDHELARAYGLAVGQLQALRASLEALSTPRTERPENRDSFDRSRLWYGAMRGRRR